MEATIWFWLGFVGFVLVLLAFDLGVLHRKPKAISVREALLTSLFYVVLAGIFNAGVFAFMGERAGFEFLTGYLIEKSLSLDNVFVFVLVFTHFAVPPRLQHGVLFWGIFGALVMRALLIFAGAALISSVHWIVLVFGAFLIFTGIKMLLSVNAEPDLGNNRIIRFARKRLRVTEDFEGTRFFVRRNGLLWVTPLFLVLIVIEFTDLVFALDSIPAIFAVTSDPFIVFSANVFAILGLRERFVGKFRHFALRALAIGDNAGAIANIDSGLNLRDIFRLGGQHGQIFDIAHELILRKAGAAGWQ